MILDAYPTVKDTDVEVITDSLTAARDELAKANIEADEAFDRFQVAYDAGDPEDVVSRLRYEAERKADFARAAQLDYQEASFVWTSFWN